MYIGSEQLFANKENAKSQQMDLMRNRNYSQMDDKKLRETASEFESLFLNNLFKSMRSTVPKDEWLNGGMKQEIFEDMLYNEYARNFSKMGGIGLGDMVYRYLKQNQGKS